MSKREEITGELDEAKTSAEEVQTSLEAAVSSLEAAQAEQVELGFDDHGERLGGLIDKVKEIITAVKAAADKIDEVQTEL